MAHKVIYKYDSKARNIYCHIKVTYEKWVRTLLRCLLAYCPLNHPGKPISENPHLLLNNKILEKAHFLNRLIIISIFLEPQEKARHCKCIPPTPKQQRLTISFITILTIFRITHFLLEYTWTWPGALTFRYAYVKHVLPIFTCSLSRYPKLTCVVNETRNTYLKESHKKSKGTDILRSCPLFLILLGSYNHDWAIITPPPVCICLWGSIDQYLSYIFVITYRLFCHCYANLIQIDVPSRVPVKTNASI